MISLYVIPKGNVFPSSMGKFHLICVAFSNPPFGDPSYEDSIANFFSRYMYNNI